jgi:hypothetical protein
MRHRRLIVLICGVVILASVFPVGAQSGMWPVTDAKGWFTISFPGDWEVTSRRGAVPDKAQAGAVENPLSMVTATAPRGRQHLPALSVMTIMLPDEFSGTAFSLLARFRRSQTQWLSEPGYTIVKEGRARVAGHQAYYQYATLTLDSPRVPAGRFLARKSLYAVNVFLGEGRLGVWATGYTLNDPARVQRDFAAISRILETIHLHARASASIPLPTFIR